VEERTYAAMSWAFTSSRATVRHGDRSGADGKQEHLLSLDCPSYGGH